MPPVSSEVFVQRIMSVRATQWCLFSAIPPKVVIRMGGKKAQANLVITLPHDVGTQFARSICHFTTICLPFYESASDLSLIFPLSALTTSFVTNGTRAIVIVLIYSKFKMKGRIRCERQ